MMKIRDNFKGSANNKVGTQAERLAAYDEYYESINDVLKSTEQKGFTAAFFAPLAYLRHFGVSLHRISAFRDGCMSGEDLSKGDPRLTWRKKCLGLPARGGNATLMVFNYTVMAVDKFIRKESLSVLPNAAYEVELCRENVARLNKLIRDFGNDKESGAI